MHHNHGSVPCQCIQVTGETSDVEKWSVCYFQACIRYKSLKNILKMLKGLLFPGDVLSQSAAVPSPHVVMSRCTTVALHWNAYVCYMHMTVQFQILLKSNAISRQSHRPRIGAIFFAMQNKSLEQTDYINGWKQDEHQETCAQPVVVRGTKQRSWL